MEKPDMEKPNMEKPNILIYCCDKNGTITFLADRSGGTVWNNNTVLQRSTIDEMTSLANMDVKVLMSYRDYYQRYGDTSLPLALAKELYSGKLGVKIQVH
jgi:hypothetical protein